jgi:uncharacterized protein
MKLHNHHPLRIFAISSILTVALGIGVLLSEGLGGLWLFVILVILEVTFSFDNAVVNSKVLATMSDFWQKIFLTVGIFIAVFVVRFLLPIVIVMIAAGTGFMEVVDLAFNQPDEYSRVLHEAAPMIDAFGGAFLMMIGVYYFMDRQKDVHWIKSIEGKLSILGKIHGLKLILMSVVALLLYLTVDDAHKNVVLISSAAGIILHVGLGWFAAFFEKNEEKLEEGERKASKSSSIKKRVGWSAFASFMYLEILDASFSLDGVIGAFAITSNIVLIIAGLGAGAVWVRSLTVYLLRAGTLMKYKYLEHGAHWAILALGIVMIIKLYHVTLPEWMIGSLGLVFIITAIASSVIEKRRQDVREAAKA